MQANKEELLKLKEKAEKQIQAGKWGKALELYEQINKLDAKNDRVMRRLGDIYLKLGEKYQAKESYKRLAELYARNGFWAKAISTNKLVLELDPLDVSVQTSIAQLYSKMGIQKVAKDDKSKSGVVETPPDDAPLELDTKPAAATPANYAAMMDMYIGGNLIEYSDTPEPLIPESAEPPVSQPTISVDADSVDLVDLDDEVIELNDEIAPASQMRIPLFSEFGTAELLAIIQHLTVRKVPASSVICKEGDVGDSIYVIANGTATVSSDGGTIAELHSGDFFGEFGLLSDGKRHATVTSKTVVEIMEITKADFRSIASQHPSVLQVLDQYYRQRLIDTLLRQNAVFGGLMPAERQALLCLFEFRKVAANSYLVNEGDTGGDLYFIKSGDFEVSIKRFNDVVVVAELSCGDFFGEIALVTGQRRTATVRAKSAGEVLYLAQANAMKVIEQYPTIKAKLEKVVVDRAEDALAAYRSHQELKKEMALV